MAPNSSRRSQSSTTELIAALKAGDIAAFEAIYLKQFERLCGYVSTFVSDDEAADVVQEVFWALWNARESLRVQNENELSYYLLRAVRNRALNVLRQRRLQETTVSLAEFSANEAALFDDEQFTQIEALIKALPERSREVLTLRWYHGLGFEQIASLMGISYGSAHVLHTRALAMVRKRLGLL
jgi:RNA polymerase sigma-70 factor (ECF subfamily)